MKNWDEACFKHSTYGLSNSSYVTFVLGVGFYPEVIASTEISKVLLRLILSRFNYDVLKTWSRVVASLRY